MSAFLDIERIEVLRARDERDRPLWLLDVVGKDRAGAVRIVVGDYYSKAHAIVAALEWECQGYRVVWPEGRQ